MTILERARFRWEARRELRAITREPLAVTAVKRLTIRHKAVRALRSPLVPAVAGVALMAGLALVLVGVVVGIGIATELSA